MSTVTPSLCSKRCPLVIDNTQVKEAAPTTYAMLFDGSGDSASFGTRLPDDLFANCQSDGGDICFTSDSAGATQLAVELVAISTGSKTCEIWVPVTFSATTGTTTIYVWYKSKSGTLTQPTASGSFGSQAVWTAVGSLQGVWHLGNGSVISTTDSTSNGKTLTLRNTPAAAAGKIGGGMTCAPDATNDKYADCANITLGTTTLQAWGSLTSNPVFFNILLAELDVSSNGVPGLLFALNNTTAPQDQRFSGGSSAFNATSDTTAVSTASGFVLWTGTYNLGSDGKLRLYRNGTLVGTPTTTGSPATASKRFGIGNNGSDANRNPPQAWPGVIDEVRVSSVARSANYIATDYAIQSSTSLVTVGTPANVVILPPPFLFQGAI